MNTILDFLGADHRACDDLFALAEEAVAKSNRVKENWDSARTLFSQFQTAITHHLAMEETVFFPAFEARSGNRMGPTQVMRMEHEQMRALLVDMAQAASAGDASTYLGLSETLNMLMQQHNLKEENMLYPMADQMLGGERDAVILAMEAVSND